MLVMQDRRHGPPMRCPSPSSFFSFLMMSGVDMPILKFSRLIHVTIQNTKPLNLLIMLRLIWLR